MSDETNFGTCISIAYHEDQEDYAMLTRHLETHSFVVSVSERLRAELKYKEEPMSLEAFRDEFYSQMREYGIDDLF